MPPLVLEKGLGQGPWPNPSSCSNVFPIPQREFMGWPSGTYSSCLLQSSAPRRASCPGTSVLAAGRSNIVVQLCVVAKFAEPVLQAPKRVSQLQCCL
eukprot:4059400-Amphidinium_carterae.1